MEANETVLSTKDVARLIGVTVDSLARAAWAERIAPPEKTCRGRFIWREKDIDAARNYFHRGAR